MKGEFNMEVLFLGTVVPQETSKLCFSKGIKTSAADIAQRYMLHGIECAGAVNTLDVISSVRIKPWPKIPLLRIPALKQEVHKGEIISVGYFNLPFVGFFLRERSLMRAARKWAREHKNKTDIIIFIYSMHSPFLKVAEKIKNLLPEAKIVLTVADLPLLMDMRGTVRKIIKKIDWKRIKRLMPIVDKYLLYTKYMADYLHLSFDKWMLFEGLIDENKIVTEPQEKYKDKICVYAGNLDARYGIDMLITAFCQIKTNAKLFIYGAGFDGDRIKRMVESLDNVEYKGQVPPDEMFEIMKKSTLLINPRPATIGLAKYSCPSKTFEYMASGTPVIMNKLPGLPEEYYPYVNFFCEETTDGFVQGIDELLSRPGSELINMGLKAANFLKKEKNSRKVMEKVLRFI